MRLVYIAVGLVFDARIGHLDRRNGIVDDRLGTHYTRETDVLATLRHRQLLFAAYHQVSVGQHIDYGNSDCAVKIISGCGLAFAIKLIGGRRPEIDVFW